ncbi:MAG: replication-associated recombination protein A [Actinobacteria bacterium]|nr:replication-associated recombination protein A [Actinomycetota bacterium]
MRPASLEEVAGHADHLGAEGFLRRAIADDDVPSLILYGPPGTGKTTLARVMATSTRAEFEELSAVSAGLADVRAVMQRARDRLAAGTRTVLFIDEIHRFTKSQQDALLPAVEDGLVVLVGATTENPYYEVNAALVSRMRVLQLEALAPADILALVERAIADERGLAGTVTVNPEAREVIVRMSGGDARYALNLLEASAGLAGDGPVTSAVVERAAGGRAVVYDKDGDQHYNVISAFIKSLRGSDPDAALYWMAVMLEGGEDPKFIARRMIVAASEDIGNADPRALEVAVAAARALEFVGLPEARINLAQAATYLALAPKSDAAYRGIDAAIAQVQGEGARVPPIALRDASSTNRRNLGHGAGYVNPHGAPGRVTGDSCMPVGMEDVRFYEPGGVGPEGELAARLAAFRARARGADGFDTMPPSPDREDDG